MKVVQLVLVLLALTVTAVASPQQAAARVMALPLSRPGETLVVRKLVDRPAGLCELVSDDGSIRGYGDMHAALDRERGMLRRRFGCMDVALQRRYLHMAEHETTDVFVYPRVDAVRYPSRFTATPAQMATYAQGLGDLGRRARAGAIAARHGIPFGCIGPDGGIQCRVDCAGLRRLAFDPDVASVSCRSEPMPLALVMPFSHLAEAALNPGAHPADPAGDGVRIGIVESEGEHRDQVTMCAINAAPNASLFLKDARYYFTMGTDTWLGNNLIEVASLSLTRDPSEVDADNVEFMLMDDYAYRWPCPLFTTPAGNAGTGAEVQWQSYSAVSVGSVRHWQEQAYVFDNFTSTRNPEPRMSACIGAVTSGCPGDRELPELLAPGSHPYEEPETDNPACRWQNPAVTFFCGDPDAQQQCGAVPGATWPAHKGTSYSAPTANGAAARVISANPTLLAHKPDATKMVLLLTAHNVDAGYWDPAVDGRDGAGVVSVHDAVEYAVHCTDLTGQITPAAAESGFYTAQADSGMSDRAFSVLVPDTTAPARHLRIALVWTTNPDFTRSENVLSDLDIGGLTDDRDSVYGSYSLEASVEMFDVPREHLTPGRPYDFTVYARDIRIPDSSRTDFFYYTVGWTWVRDHADSTVGIGMRGPPRHMAGPALHMHAVLKPGAGIAVDVGGFPSGTEGVLTLHTVDGRVVRRQRVSGGPRQVLLSARSLGTGTYLLSLRVRSAMVCRTVLIGVPHAPQVEVR